MVQEASYSVAQEDFLRGDQPAGQLAGSSQVECVVVEFLVPVPQWRHWFIQNT